MPPTASPSTTIASSAFSRARSSQAAGSPRCISRFCATRGFTVMMEAMAVPPFERFYVEHRDVVFGFLVRRVGRAQAEDAFQETFLRALRGWNTLRHGRHLRAWVLTIAARV